MNFLNQDKENLLNAVFVNSTEILFETTIFLFRTLIGDMGKELVVDFYASDRPQMHVSHAECMKLEGLCYTYSFALKILNDISKIH